MEDEPEAAGADALLAELTAVFAQLRGLCLRIALATVRDFALAEEVVQESFLSAWQHARARYDPDRGSMESWVLAMTRNKAIDAVRRAEHLRRVQRLEEAEPRRDRTIDLTDDLAFRHDEERQLRSSLCGLPPSQRRVLLLMYWHGLSQSQISDHDATPLGTVKSRATAALHRLRGTVEGHAE